MSKNENNDNSELSGGFIFTTKEPVLTFFEWMEMKLKECIENEDYEEAKNLKRDIESLKRNSYPPMELNSNLMGIVDLDVAKEIKKSGFSLPTEFYYLDKDLPFVEKGLKRNENGDKINHNEFDEYIYSAPTTEEYEYWKTSKK
jgi:hypothetical protein